METNFEKDKTIIVPTDFSEACTNAIKRAIELSRPYESKIYVLHVTENKETAAAALDKINKIVAPLGYGNIEAIVKEGDIFTTINEVAVSLKADFIILGTHGKKGMQKLFGSYAMKVIDSTKMPVIVVQNASGAGKLENIVFPVDANEEDRQKSGYAVQLAKAYGAKIHILPKVEKLTANKAKAESVMKQIKAFMVKHEANFVIAENNDADTDFAKIVITYSEAVHADMILILSDASSHFPLFGAKEEELMFNKSQIPVMCVAERQYKSVNFSTAG